MIRLHDLNLVKLLLRQKLNIMNSYNM